MEQLYRQEVLDRLSSPERLDELLHITPTRSWIALISVSIVILTLVYWGIFGAVTTKVDAIGIFVDPRGIRPVVAVGSGRLIAVHIRVGDKVAKGQLVATMDNVDIQKRLDTEKATLAALEEQFSRDKDLLEQEAESKQRVLSAQRENTNNSIRIQQDKAKWLEDRLQAYEELFQQGLVLKRQVIETKLERDNTFLDVDKLKNDLGNIKLQEVQLQENMQQRLFKQRFDIQQSQGKVQLIKQELDEATRVISPIEGNVVSIEAMDGAIVPAGKTILNVESTRPKLGLFMVVSAFKGKKIVEGMTVQITPSTVKREEYGYMFGVVKDIDEFPVTPDSLLRRTNNPDLVQDALKKGPLISADVELVADSKTRSGFKWSSRKGDSVTVTAGTIGAAEVVVKSQAPITLVIPKLRSWLGE